LAPYRHPLAELGQLMAAKLAAPAVKSVR